MDAREQQQDDASALAALEEPQVERAMQWWKKLRLYTGCATFRALMRATRFYFFGYFWLLPSPGGREN